MNGRDRAILDSVFGRFHQILRHLIDLHPHHIVIEIQLEEFRVERLTSHASDAVVFYSQFHGIVSFLVSTSPYTQGPILQQ